jgi:hypothetical protein
MKNLRETRDIAGLSLLRLSRLSGVSRYKLNLCELYKEQLSPAEEQAVRCILAAEVQRVIAIASRIQNEHGMVAV